MDSQPCGNSLKQGKNSKLCRFSATWSIHANLWLVAEWRTDIILKTGVVFCALTVTLMLAKPRSLRKTLATTMLKLL